MKYIVHQEFFEDRIFMSVDDLRNYLEDLDYHNDYDEAIDDCYGPVHIGPCSYSPAQVLKAVDPVEYRCGYTDWINDRIADLINDLDRLDFPLPFFDYIISCEEEEEEE